MDREEFKRTFGFEAPDLSGAEAVTEIATNKLQFDKDEYTDLEAITYGLSQLSDKPSGKRPSVKSLSVNGKVVNDRMDKYLAHAGESSSALKEALKSPKHYLIYKNENLKPKDESHFTLGTFIHSAFLEPNKFAKVRVLPEAAKNTIEGLQTLIKFYSEVLRMEPEDLSRMNAKDLRLLLTIYERRASEDGYTFIKKEDNDIVNVIRSSYMSYAGGILPRLVRNGRTETSMYGVDPVTGLKVKIRPDCMLLEEQVGANIILSVKTTSQTTIEAFMRDAAKFRYELAEGMYLQVASEITGRHFSGTMMLVCQTVIPFQCFLLWLDPEDLQIGKYKYRLALDVVKQAKESRRYPGFECYAEDGSCGLITARFPDYIKNEVNPQNI